MSVRSPQGRPGAAPRSSKPKSKSKPSATTTPASTSTGPALSSTPVGAVGAVDAVDVVETSEGRPASTKATSAKASAPRPLGSAVVIGAGPTGLAQAALLLKRAKDVGLTRLTVVEKREVATRPVGLFFRQPTLDALRWLDAESFAELCQCSGLVGKDGSPRGFVARRLDDEGAIVAETPRTPKPASASRFALSALDRDQW